MGGTSLCPPERVYSRGSAFRAFGYRIPSVATQTRQNFVDSGAWKGLQQILKLPTGLSLEGSASQTPRLRVEAPDSVSDATPHLHPKAGSPPQASSLVALKCLCDPRAEGWPSPPSLLGAAETLLRPRQLHGCPVFGWNIWCLWVWSLCS